MRLWHTKLLPFLPKGQLLSQWRELNSIFAKEDKHILINYIYDYPKDDLYTYTEKVIEEMTNRGYKVRTRDKMERYFTDIDKVKVVTPFRDHHNDEYLEICYYNLKEKYIRGQKDYDEALFQKLEAFVKN
ncbi:pyrimidine dimer DNA glycosylase/endonuclease V [Lysinibacillus sp. NPDC096418]|uniref:pyrimidine dimer DNA glycosylase/endonuclease V n=1 Tax=Lysinibacillus sp. NPDC096418 TaxID=3364138 RepID=UPI003807ABB5